jgi:hypothetical protein
MPENQSPAARRQRRQSDIVGMVFLILMLPILLVTVVPMVIVVGGIYLFVAVLLHIAVVLLWLPRGRSVLFVYSDSPIWQAYIEAEILPRLPPQTTVLNWSNRKNWPRFSLPTWLFNMFAGSREFNPIAIVFRPLAPPKRFRFWRAFRDYKHGKPERLRQVEADFFRCVEQPPNRPLQPTSGGHAAGGGGSVGTAARR